MRLFFNIKSFALVLCAGTILPGGASASTCIGDWPVLCAEDEVFLLGHAEIRGRVDASAIGMGTQEPFRLNFTS